MVVFRACRRRWLALLAPVCSILFLWLPMQAFMSQQPLMPVRLVRTIKSSASDEWQPTALTLSTNPNEFWLINQPQSAASPTLVRLSRLDELITEYTLPATIKPHALAYDSQSGQALLLDTAHSQLLVVALPAQQSTNTLSIVARYSSAAWGGLQIQALALDGPKRLAYLLDPARHQLLIQQMQPDQSAPAATTPTVINLAVSAQSSLAHLAHHPTSGHLFTIDVNQWLLDEFTVDGALINTYDLAGLGLQAPQGMVFAPSTDPTDAPETIHLFLTDSNQSEEQRLLEIAIAPVEAPVFAASVEQATLVRIIDTGAFTYPSPDSSDIVYIAPSPFVNNSGHFIIVDGEVEEIVAGITFYKGANMFEINLAGQLVTTYTTYPEFSSEPVGAAFNPLNGHLFISDDDKRRIHEINPGPDKTYRTADDTRTVTQISAFGGVDAEGIAFSIVDGMTPTLFLADGVSSEVYKITSGPDGRFGGITPDDVVTHFDTAMWDIVDPEGITFNPANHHIYITGTRPPPGHIANRLAEFTLNGSFVRFIDISTAAPIKPAGVALGPSSQDPTQNALYIVDRGIDNNVNPTLKDGRLYEFTLPEDNDPPTVDAGSTQATTVGDRITLTATVNDDGRPNPPAALTLLWEKVSGPGTVTFDTATQARTHVTFDTVGSYLLRVTANDGEFRVSDEVTVTVAAANTPPQANAGNDQSVLSTDGATLDGAVSDDGLPNPPGKVTVDWAQVSGPATAQISSPNTAKTRVSFTLDGTYVFRLTATDGLLTANDEVKIKVTKANQAPVVELADSQIVTLTQLTELIDIMATISDDGDPSQLSLDWVVKSGSGTVLFSNTHSATTSVQFGAVGHYTLEVTVSDGEYTITKTTDLTVVLKTEESNRSLLPIIRQ